MKTMTFVDPSTGQVTEVWDGREAMRTLVDALAKLQQLGALAHNGQTEIRAGPMRHPDGSTAATVAVSAWDGGSSWRIMMPSTELCCTDRLIGRVGAEELGGVGGLPLSDLGRPPCLSS